MSPLCRIVLAFAALPLLAVGVPVDVEKRDIFTFIQTLNRFFIRKGPLALATAYRKYNVRLPQDVAVAAANVSNGVVSNDGTVTASPERYDAEYLCPVSIGGQILNLDFDTGSSDLWCFSNQLSASSQNGHSVYNPAASSTFKNLPGYTWSISYGDKSGASGNVGTDTVSIGSTTVTGQAVELAQQISAQFERDRDNDGLLGLAFSKINTVKPVKQNTFFDNVKSSLSLPIFTAYLKRNAPGSYDFGFIDSKKYKGSLNYVNVNSARGFWQFTSTGYTVGNGAFVSQSFDAIADTGTSLLLIPQAIVSAYYAKVRGAGYDSRQGGYTFPCSAALPSLTISIGTYQATVPGFLINYAPVSSVTCFGGVQANSNLPFSIFGDVFLKSQFVVFDGSAVPRLGFAPQA